MIAQSFNDWEAVVVLDGDDEDLAKVVGDYAAADQRFIIVATAHGGVSSARNTGLAEAAAQWVVFLDADDTLSPDFIAKMLKKAQSGDAVDCVVCGFIRKNSNGESFAHLPPPALDEDAVEICRAGPPAAIHCFLTRKSVIDEIGGFDERLAAGEDWDLWLRLSETEIRFAVIRKPLAQYWSNDGSLSRSGTLLIENFGKVYAYAAMRENEFPAESDSEDAYDSRHVADKMLGHVFWSAGVSIGEMGSATDLVAKVSPSADWRFQKNLLAARLIDGMVVGSGIARKDQWKKWADFAPELYKFIHAIAARFGPTFSYFAILHQIESEVIRAGIFPGPLDIGVVNGQPITLRTLLKGVTPSPQADIIMFRLRWLKPSTIASFVAPNFGAMSGIEVWRTIWRVNSRRMIEVLWRSSILSSVILRLRRLRALLYRVTGIAPPAVFGFHIPIGAQQARIATEARYTLPSGKAESPVLPVKEIADLPNYRPEPVGDSDHPATGAGAEEWDRFFETEDPWDYGNAYEQLKYQRTLDMISGKRAKNALELACAEGRFTAYLAPHVDHLLALDISQNALDRAAKRNSGATNIRFGQSDFFKDGIAGSHDLIVCSEVLYYMESEKQLETFCSQVAKALEEGGCFVHAHGFQLVDSPERTAFDWDDSFGAATIYESLCETEGLVPTHSIVTELYRIDLFEKQTGSAKLKPQTTTHMELETDLAPAVASSIVWNGAIATRADVSDDRCYQMPVLMYHRIATDGPAGLADYRIAPHVFEQQLRFLRRRGYHSVTPDEWHHGARRGGSLRGRPVMITFDDAYQDFADVAWPILQRNGFGAHMFVPTGKIGIASDWDARFGEPAKIMDWATLARLVGEGLTVGSHLVTHTSADLLPTPDLLDEAIRSRITLEHVTGGSIKTIAPPYGINDNRVEQILAAAGYTHSFVAEGGLSPVCGFEMRCPRIGIYAGMSLDDFATIIGRDDEMPDDGDKL